MSASSEAESAMFRLISLSIALIIATNLVLCHKKKMEKTKSAHTAVAAPLPGAASTDNFSQEQMFNAELEAAKNAKQAREDEEVKKAIDAELEAALKAQKERKSQMEKEKAVDFAKPTVMIKLEKPLTPEKLAVVEKPTVMPVVAAVSPCKKKENLKLAEQTMVPTKIVVAPKVDVKTEVIMLPQPKEITLPPLPAAIQEEKVKRSQKDRESKKTMHERQVKDAADTKVLNKMGKEVDKSAAKVENVADKQVDKSKLVEKQEDKMGVKQDKVVVDKLTTKPLDTKSPLKDAKNVIPVNIAVEKSRKKATTLAPTTLIVQSQYIAEDVPGDGKLPAVSMYVKKKK